jgi:hypothetical protein
VTSAVLPVSENNVSGVIGNLFAAPPRIAPPRPDDKGETARGKSSLTRARGIRQMRVE